MKRSIAPIGKTYTMNRRLVLSLFLAALTVGIAVLSIRPVSAVVDPVTHWNTTAVQAFVTAGQSIAGSPHLGYRAGGGPRRAERN